MLRSRSFAVLPLLLALAAAPLPVQAQWGGLMKKAAEKAAGKVAGDAAQKSGVEQQGRCSAPSFDETTLELTSERVAKLVAGLRARQNAGGGKRAQLAAQRDAAQQRLQQIESDGSIQEAENSHSEWASCQNEGFQQIMEKRMAEKGGGAGMTPEFMRAMREHQDKIAAAQAKGDTARANALQDSTYLVYYKVVAPTKADSAAVQAKCGTEPKPSRRVAERDSLRRTVRELGDQIREIDEQADDDVARASGMTRPQFAMALERVRTALASDHPCGFTDAERDAIHARHDELQQLISGK